MMTPPKPYDVMVLLAASHMIHFIDGSSVATVGELAKKMLTGIDQAGLAIVPKKATPEMLVAGRVCDRDVDEDDFETVYGRIWECMVNAAP
jgi:hypothetical protein